MGLFSSFSQPKGKPGTKGQKTIVIENEATLKFYLYVMAGANVSSHNKNYCRFNKAILVIGAIQGRCAVIA